MIKILSLSPQRSLLFLLCTLLCLSGCQVYRNNGRNLFESAAPGHVNPNAGFQIADTPTSTKEQNCWQQYITDPIWTKALYTVQRISPELIEVCVDDAVSDL